MQNETKMRTKLSSLGLDSYVSYRLESLDAKVTVYYVNGEIQSYRVIGVSSYSQHGKRVVCLKVDADFSDVFYFEHESFYIAEGGDVLTFLPNTDTPQTRISFHPPDKSVFTCWECHCIIDDRPDWTQEDFDADPFCGTQCYDQYYYPDPDPDYPEP